MKPILLTLPLVLCLQTAFACANWSWPEPEPRISLPSAADRLKTAFAIDLGPRGYEKERDLRNSTSIEGQSDYAVALCYLGRAREAVTILEKLEASKPGQYPIAANLGTAYELSGNNEAALHWIKEGIRRNPESHHGTEWLHVKILEAKIAHAKDPAYWTKHSVLKLTPASAGNDSHLVVDGRLMPLDEVMKALDYQLGERLQFVKNPDGAVGSLIADYARLEAAGNRLESARDMAAMAMQFGYRPAEGKAMLSSFKRQILWNSTKDVGSKVGLGALGIGLFGFVFMKWLNRPIC